MVPVSDRYAFGRAGFESTRVRHATAHVGDCDQPAATLGDQPGRGFSHIAEALDGNGGAIEVDAGVVESALSGEHHAHARGVGATTPGTV